MHIYIHICMYVCMCVYTHFLDVIPGRESESPDGCGNEFLFCLKMDMCEILINLYTAVWCCEESWGRTFSPLKQRSWSSDHSWRHHPPIIIPGHPNGLGKSKALVDHKVILQENRCNHWASNPRDKNIISISLPSESQDSDQIKQLRYVMMCHIVNLYMYSVCACVCVCEYIYIYMCVCGCVCVCICIYIYTRYMYIYI